MADYRHPVLIRGNYQIVELSNRDVEGGGKEVSAYLVMNSSGVLLRQELTLEAARAWMEKLIEEEMPQPAVKPPRARRAR